MKDFFIINSWLISLIAIAISFLTLLIVGIDKYRKWHIQFRTRKLKEDLVILKRIVELNVDDFYTLQITEENNKHRRMFLPEYSKLHFVFQNINENDIKNKIIKKQLHTVKTLKHNDLFLKITTPEGCNLSFQFCAEIDELIKMTKKHLAQVI
jgi:hypothetical protein